ncbi:ABC-three component system middle component 1 [Faecalicatena orotica]|uniref:ABC-three component system middle component 1 n=1 Tax=Faecalicatena orotica TaxID=1544 RepID=UPI0032167DB0
MKMGFENIVPIIQEYAVGKYKINVDNKKVEELKDFFDATDGSVEVLRIKRWNSVDIREKTLVCVDLSVFTDGIKNRLKNILKTTALLKESLFDTENVDLYLFLALPKSISEEECIRIESTEQLCRKYVLMPHEELNTFLDRTFLSKIMLQQESIDIQDPVQRSFKRIEKKYEWLSDGVQNNWKEYFRNYSGSELVEKIIDEVV